MAKYTDLAVQEAWADFEQHLIDVGFIQPKNSYISNTLNYETNKTKIMLAHMAFKQGFLQGAVSMEKEKIIKFQPFVFKNKEGEPGDQIETRKNRTKEQIELENITIESILKANYYPMKLADIQTEMREQGFTHWTNQNACGFVKYAIKSGMNIEKVKPGVYSYVWKGRE